MIVPRAQPWRRFSRQVPDIAGDSVFRINTNISFVPGVKIHCTGNKFNGLILIKRICVHWSDFSTALSAKSGASLPEYPVSMLKNGIALLQHSPLMHYFPRIFSTVKTTSCTASSARRACHANRTKRNDMIGERDDRKTLGNLSPGVSAIFLSNTNRIAALFFRKLFCYRFFSYWSKRAKNPSRKMLTPLLVDAVKRFNQLA